MKTILVNGLGYSGSSAVVDYLKEFSSIKVFENAGSFIN